MNEVLIEAFQQKDWAMKALITACEVCSVDELTRPAAGFGSILATLNHLVSADAGYVASLGGGRAVWAVAGIETNDLRELTARVEENGARWEQFLREPVDGERLAFLDDGAYETHAAVVVMQALHHASVHGEQVCKSLEALGVEPPDLQPWAYADATGRSRWLRPEGDKTMTKNKLLRMDNVGIVVDALDEAVSFFAELGLKLEGRATVEGEWAGRVTGLGNQRVEIAMMVTPDGHSRLEISRFLTPPVVADHRNAPVNALGYLRVMFTVEDIDEMLARLRKRGAELVGEVVQYEDSYRLCYIRGPEGLLIGLAEQLG